MRSSTVRQGPFQRIGDCFANYFDREHFLGRNALGDSWVTKPETGLLKLKEGLYRTKATFHSMKIFGSRKGKRRSA